MDSAVNGGSKDVQRLKFRTRNKEDGAANRRKESVEPISSNEAALPPPPDMSSAARLDFVGATLQLRGEHLVKQPLIDSAGNLLIYNGAHLYSSSLECVRLLWSVRSFSISSPGELSVNTRLRNVGSCFRFLSRSSMF